MAVVCYAWLKCWGKDVMVNPNEATAVVFAAAALTHMSENLNLYPVE